MISRSLRLRAVFLDRQILYSNALSGPRQPSTPPFFVLYFLRFAWDGTQVSPRRSRIKKMDPGSFESWLQQRSGDAMISGVFRLFIRYKRPLIITEQSETRYTL